MPRRRLKKRPLTTLVVHPHMCGSYNTNATTPSGVTQKYKPVIQRLVVPAALLKFPFLCVRRAEPVIMPEVRVVGRLCQHCGRWIFFIVHYALEACRHPQSASRPLACGTGTEHSARLLWYTLVTMTTCYSVLVGGVNNATPTLIAQSLWCIFIVTCESLGTFFISLPTHLSIHPSIYPSFHPPIPFGLTK